MFVIKLFKKTYFDQAINTFNVDRTTGKGFVRSRRCDFEYFRPKTGKNYFYK